MMTVGDMKKVCADGSVSRGEGVINESAVTGESMPVSKSRGSRVVSGTIVQNGYLEVSLSLSFTLFSLAHSLFHSYSLTHTLTHSLTHIHHSLTDHLQLT